MFCKWCGNSIQLTDKKCALCGRDTPPMSDCGGLYNLKHSNDATIVSTTEKEIVKEVSHYSTAEKMEGKYTKERKTDKIHYTIATLCFFVVLLVIVCTVLFVIRVNYQLDELKEQIGNIRIEGSNHPTEDDTNESTEGKSDDAPVESTQYSFIIDTTVVNDDHKEISNTYDFGGYAKSVKVTSSTVEDKNEQEFIVSYILNEEKSVNLNLKYIQKDTKQFTLGVMCNTDLSFFNNQDFSYEWQYRTDIKNWIAADADIITVDDENYCRIACTTDWLKNITIMKQPIELRCIIQIKNENGDSMQITVDGISVTLDGTIINNNE